MTPSATDRFNVRLARSEAELLAAQRLRYDVFVRELGGGGEMVDHDAGIERDRFDPFFDHLILTETGSEAVIGVYRLLRSDMAAAAGGYYSEAEYDLSALIDSKRRLLELGRSCLHPDHRKGMALHRLWQGLAAYIDEHRIEVLFGVASFHGTDVTRFAAPLSLLHHRYLAPPALRVRARETGFQSMDMIDEDTLDRRAAMLQMPSLIKAYLRMGGCVGEGAFVDHAFNTTDVCLILDVAQMDAKQARLYQGIRT